MKQRGQPQPIASKFLDAHEGERDSLRNRSWRAIEIQHHLALCGSAAGTLDGADEAIKSLVYPLQSIDTRYQNSRGVPALVERDRASLPRHSHFRTPTLRRPSDIVTRDGSLVDTYSSVACTTESRRIGNPMRAGSTSELYPLYTHAKISAITSATRTKIKTAYGVSCSSFIAQTSRESCIAISHTPRSSASKTINSIIETTPRAFLPSRLKLRELTGAGTHDSAGTRLSSSREGNPRQDQFSRLGICSVGGVSCVQYRSSVFPKREKLNARSCRALHDCAALHNSAGVRRLSGRSRPPKHWRRSRDVLSALPPMKSLASANRLRVPSPRSLSR